MLRLLSEIPDELISRKLAGLVLFFAFAILVLVLWMVAAAFFDLPWEPFVGVTGLGAQGATAHQAAQAAADRAVAQSATNPAAMQVHSPPTVLPPPTIPTGYTPRIP